jgi:glycosyltransferase involved in cell wall biosynthesis
MDVLEQQGHAIDLASHLRSFDRDGDAARQQRIKSLGQQVAQRLVARYQALPAAERPTAWITYHAYHKSPDWLGPAVRAALGIPYLLIEASFAPKQAGGPWDFGHRATERAIRGADVVLAITEVDRIGLSPLIEAPSQLQMFPPFLDHTLFARASEQRQSYRKAIAERFNMDPAVPWLLTVGMMRDDVKRKSYELLTRALQKIINHSWQILVVGEGQALPIVERQLSSLGSERVRMAGILGETELAACYAAADVYAWPAVREAYGLAMLEAQASGLPVVAGHEGGVADVVRDTETGLLTPPRDPDAFAAAVVDLLDHPDKRRSMGRAAKMFVERERGLDCASNRLDQALSDAFDIFVSRRSQDYAGKV